MNLRINKKENTEGRVKITVTRSFGTQNLLEIYANYVAKKIKDLLRKERGKNDEEKSEKNNLHI